MLLFVKVRKNGGDPRLSVEPVVYMLDSLPPTRYVVEGVGLGPHVAVASTKEVAAQSRGDEGVVHDQTREVGTGAVPPASLQLHKASAPHDLVTDDATQPQPELASGPCTPPSAGARPSSSSLPNAYYSRGS